MIGACLAMCAPWGIAQTVGNASDWGLTVQDIQMVDCSELVSRPAISGKSKAIVEAAKVDQTASLLAGMLADPECGQGKSHAEATAWYRRVVIWEPAGVKPSLMSDASTARAANSFGMAYRGGDGIQKSAADAVRWFRRSADAGNPRGMYNLADAYLNGEGVAKSFTEALVWYRLSAKAGYAPAMSSMGDMYFHGRGVTKNEGQALYQYGLAGLSGDPYGYYSAGWMYENGRGVKARDYTEAMTYYTWAANKGYGDAMTAIGMLHFFGKGTPVNYAESARWYRRGAAAGNFDSMKRLGWALEWGLGVPRDMAEARIWYKKSADSGDDDAKYHLANIGRGRLSADKNGRTTQNWSSGASSSSNCRRECVNYAVINGANQCVNEAEICN